MEKRRRGDSQDLRARVLQYWYDKILPGSFFDFAD
jgi:hypothetical protein